MDSRRAELYSLVESIWKCFPSPEAKVSFQIEKSSSKESFDVEKQFTFATNPTQVSLN